MTAPIRSMDEIVAAMRARKEALNIGNDIIDELAGLPTRYTSKVMARMRSPGYISLGPMLEVLGLSLQIVEDTDALGRIERRHVKRKRPQKVMLAAAASIHESITQLSELSEEKRVQLLGNLMREIGAKGNMAGAASNGGKRRAKTMKKRARQQQATHAARIRWSKRDAGNHQQG